MSDIKQKLLSRPIEEETIIINQNFIQFEECLGLFENWSWDGVSACSVVLLAADVPQSNENEFIESLFRQMQFPVDKNLTKSTSGEHWFLNFNFEIL